MLIPHNSDPVQVSSQPVKLGNDSAPKVAPPKTSPSVTVKSSQQPASRQPSPEELKSAANVINQVLRQSNHSLEFSVDNDTKRPIVKLVDTDTGQLIRQIPSEETLAISRSIGQFQQGQLLKEKA